MDFIASLSHIFNGFIIMYIALYYNVSLFMFIYLASLTHFYIGAINAIQKFAKGFINTHGERSQIDVQLANKISKRYNDESRKLFLKTRSNVWKF